MFHVKQSEKEISNCPICGNKHSDDFINCDDHTVSKRSFSIVSCNSCGFKFTNPVPPEETIGDYYKSEDYVSHSGTKKGLINSVYHAVRNKTIKQKFKLVEGLSSKKKVLDVGCGTGELLNYFKNNEWEVLGLEPDSSARKFGVENYGLNVEPLDYLDSIKSNSFPVIMMWHVLEHVYNLDEEILKIKDKLESGGYLIVAVPNCDSYDARVYKENWAAYDLPRHLYHFRKKDIQTLFEKHGFMLEAIKPMKYDAYYISMISEKYKGGNFVRGIFNGFLSNRKAGKDNFSSLIYILKLRE